jgi:hypothetical protein
MHVRGGTEPLALGKLLTVGINIKGKIMGENMKRTLNLVIAVVVLAVGTSALAASFHSGNIVIYRVGGLANQTSGATLTNNGNIVWLDECLPISPTDVNNGSNLTVVQSIMLPTNYFGGYSPLIDDAAATLDGLMSRSLDGRFLVLTGFGATLGQFTNHALTTFDADFQVPRVVGLVDGSGHIDTTTVQTNSLSDGEDIRSAATTDGTNLWFSGDTSGIRYTTRGSSLATQLNSSLTNIRQLNIFSNQLYFSTASGSDIRIGTAGTQPPPTTNGTVFSNLPGFVTNTNSPRAFLLFNLAGQTNTFDTLYFVDDGSVGNGAGVYKWSLVAGATNWVNVGSITAFAARGLTGYSEISGGTTNVHLWITNGGSTGGGSALYPYVDRTGFNVDPVVNADGGDANQYVIYPSGASGTSGYDFRGIAMAPVGGETFPSGSGRISVGPITDFFLNNAFTGGPFSFTKGYSVANPGTSTVTWAASSTNWVGFSLASGTLTPGASVTVTVSFNANANSLSPGTNLSSIIFTNTTSGNNGFDVTTRPVELILSQLGVSPSSNYFAVGPVNGPYTPSSQVYTLTNGNSSSSLTWGASALSSNWLTITPASGTILAGQKATVTVSITNANALALTRGAYLDTVAFTNATTSDPGNTTRSVSLLIGGGFTSNNLVIYRAGDGVAALNNQPTPVFLDEFTRSGALIESIPVSTNNYSCSGVAVAEGLMTRSTDKQFLVFVGYGTNKTFGAPAPSSLSSVVPRVIGRVDGNGNVDVSTRLTDFNSGGNPRAAVSTNGVDMWVAGNLSGIRYTQLGDTSSSDVCTNPTANFRALNIYSNQLYAGSGSSTIRITTIGTGLPTSDIGNALNLPGISSVSFTSPYNFVMFHLKVGGGDPFDTLYVTDDQANNGCPNGGAGAISKWSLVSGSWTSNGYVNVPQVRGLAGDVSIVGTTTNVNLFAVGSGNCVGGSGTLTAYTDSNGWNAPPSTNNAPQIIATAPANERWDSIALAPEIPVTANLVLTPPSTDFDVIDQPSGVMTNSASYVVADVSNSSMTWTATWASSWLSLSTYGGTLPAGGNVNVTLSMNANATNLPNGTYLDTVSLVNKVNGQGNTAIAVSLTITNSSVVPNPFFTWQNYYFTGSPLNSSPNADPLGKGMSNTNQFLAGFNPTNPAAYLHVISIAKTNSNTDIQVTYLGANGDSSYTGGPASRTNVLEFTTGTANGSYATNSFASTGQSNILNAANGLGTVTNMVDIGGATNKPSRYYRVRVLLP